MAANMEILGITIGDIPKNNDFEHLTSVNREAEIIVKEILQDIFDTAIRKSEQEQEKLQKIMSLEVEAGDLIDLTRNYKQEFRTILQNLKCQSHRTHPTGNTSLEDQIKKVIDEIKSLETSVRLNIQEDHGDNNITEENTNLNDYKTEIIDIHTEKNEAMFTPETMNEEVVLQVIDLHEDDASEKTSSFNGFPSEEELVDVNLSDDNQEELTRSAIAFKPSTTTETSSKNLISDTKSASSALGEGSIKKKNLGQRLWHFIRKSKISSCHSLTKKRNTHN